MTVDGRDFKDAYEEFAGLVEELCEQGNISMVKELIYMRTELRALQGTENYKAKKKCGRLFLHRQGARPCRRLFRIAEDAGRSPRNVSAAICPAGRRGQYTMDSQPARYTGAAFLASCYKLLRLRQRQASFVHGAGA